jgi:serine/threonine protein kinase
MASSRYRLETLLGRGSFGQVFKAVERSSNTIVAIKEVENVDEGSILQISVSGENFLDKFSHSKITGANPTTLNYNTSVVNIYSATNSMADF